MVSLLFFPIADIEDNILSANSLMQEIKPAQSPKIELKEEHYWAEDWAEDTAGQSHHDRVYTNLYG